MTLFRTRFNAQNGISRGVAKTRRLSGVGHHLRVSRLRVNMPDSENQKFPSNPSVQMNRDSRPPRRNGISALATTMGPPGVRNFIPNDP